MTNAIDSAVSLNSFSLRVRPQRVARVDAPSRTGLEHETSRLSLAAIGVGEGLAIVADDAVSAIVPLHSRSSSGLAARPVHARLADAHAIAMGGCDVGSSLVACLGNDAGFVHLGAREWTLYWPAGVGALWFFSARSLPPLSELSHASDVPRVFRTKAVPGEIALAATRPLDVTEKHVARGLADGARATLGRLRALRAPIDGWVLKAR